MITPCCFDILCVRLSVLKEFKLYRLYAYQVVPVDRVVLRILQLQTVRRSRTLLSRGLLYHPYHPVSNVILVYQSHSFEYEFRVEFFWNICNPYILMTIRYKICIFKCLDILGGHCMWIFVVGVQMFIMDEQLALLLYHFSISIFTYFCFACYTIYNSCNL